MVLMDSVSSHPVEELRSEDSEIILFYHSVLAAYGSRCDWKFLRDVEEDELKALFLRYLENYGYCQFYNSQCCTISFNSGKQSCGLEKIYSNELSSMQQTIPTYPGYKTVSENIGSNCMEIDKRWFGLLENRRNWKFAKLFQIYTTSLLLWKS